MTKPKLRKSADISPQQSPHDGIHTCSRGCSKPGCNRSLRDTIEEQDKQIEALKRDVLEKTAELRNIKEVVADLRISAEDDLDSIETSRKENARLKAEVERLEKQNEIYNDVTADVITERDSLKAEVERLNAFTTRTIIPNEVLQAQVERLTKAGDELWEFAKLADTNAPKARRKALKDWNAAKEGKQP
jgi:chromosome segregation ATPase